MLEILRPNQREKLSKGGRKPTLTLKEMLLAALEYWREYCAYAHIAASYGIHESNMHRLIKTDLNTVTYDEFQGYEDWINNYIKRLLQQFIKIT